MSMLEGFANDGFAEVAESLFDEALAIRRGFVRRQHKKIRPTCYKCGGLHTRSEHRSHGYGSFARTHPNY